MKQAKIKKVEQYNPTTKAFFLESSEPINFTGGNWILVHSNIPKEDGNVYKRSYSICSSDRNQHEFMLIIKLVNPDHVSGYMHSLKKGDTIQFSGPHGKTFRWFEDDPVGKYLFVATHTGITAILGVLNSKHFVTKVNFFDFFWILPEDDEEYFIPDEKFDELLENIPPEDFEYTIFPEGSSFLFENSNILNLYDGIFIAGKKDIINEFEKRINKDKVILRTEYFF